MRRKDREITDIDEMRRLIDVCDTLHLGMTEGGVPYVVPLSFGWEECGGVFSFYIHGAKQGRRHSVAAASPTVCVELCVCRGFTESTGGLTADYLSFIGMGEISEVSGSEAIKGLELICRHCGFDAMPCGIAAVAATCVEKITVSEYTAKRRFKK